MLDSESPDELKTAQDLLAVLDELRAAGYYDGPLMQRARVLDARLGDVYHQMGYGSGPRDFAGLPPRMWWPSWKDQVLSTLAAIEAGRLVGVPGGGERVDEGYDVGQVCLNGHGITGNARRYPDFRKKHCPDCGAATIVACPQCKTPIQGEYWVPGVMSSFPYSPPGHCHECGAAYPWTASRLEAAKELAREAEDLTEDEREQLAGSLDDLVSDTPRTQLAASRFKRLMAKAGKGTAQAMRDIVVDIASEAAKKTIFGG